MFFARQCTQVVELTHYKLQSRESTGYFLSQTIAVADLDLGESAGRLADVGRFFMNSQWEQFLNYVLWNSD
jgi:hypothetical protein